MATFPVKRTTPYAHCMMGARQGSDGSSATNMSVTFPSAPPEGSFVFILFHASNQDVTIDQPGFDGGLFDYDGWSPLVDLTYAEQLSLLTETAGVYAFWKIAGPSEPATYSFTHGTMYAQIVAGVFEIPAGCLGARLRDSAKHERTSSILANQFLSPAELIGSHGGDLLISIVGKDNRTSGATFDLFGGASGGDGWTLGFDDAYGVSNDQLTAVAWRFDASGAPLRNFDTETSVGDTAYGRTFAFQFDYAEPYFHLVGVPYRTFPIQAPRNTRNSYSIDFRERRQFFDGVSAAFTEHGDMAHIGTPDNHDSLNYHGLACTGDSTDGLITINNKVLPVGEAQFCECEVVFTNATPGSSYWCGPAVFCGGDRPDAGNSYLNKYAVLMVSANSGDGSCEWRLYARRSGSWVVLQSYTTAPDAALAPVRARIEAVEYSDRVELRWWINGVEQTPHTDTLVSRITSKSSIASCNYATSVGLSWGHSGALDTDRRVLWVRGGNLPEEHTPQTRIFSLSELPAVASIVFPVRRVRTSQPPPAGAAVDWSNPINEDLVRAVLPIRGFDGHNLATGKRLSLFAGTPAWEASQFGEAQVGSETGSGTISCYSTDEPFSALISPTGVNGNTATSAITQMAIATVRGPRDISSELCIGESGASNADRANWQMLTVSDRWRYSVGTGFGGPQVDLGGASNPVAPAIGGTYLMIGTYDNVTGDMTHQIKRLDTDGYDEGSANAATNDDLDDLNQFMFANHEDSGSLGYCAWKRVLTAAERKSLLDNPWQVFEPEIVWYKMDAATGEISVVQITSVDGDDSWADGATGLVILGSGFLP